MKMPNIKIMTALAAVACLLVTACSSDPEGPETNRPDGGGETASSPDVTVADDGSVTFNTELTIVVNDKPTAEREEDLAFWEESVKRFNEQWPEVTIEGQEVAYEPQAFQAQLTAGNLPIQMVVPFTEPRRLGENQQVADITEDLKSLGLYEQLNPDLLQNVEVGGGVYAIPYQAYAQGLAVNRDLMTQAGLDPDAPPATWDEVREAAKAITDATGEAGFGFPTTGNYGGWMFTTMCYSYGGTIQDEEGTQMTIANPGCTKALQTLKDMRWADGSMSANAVYSDEQLWQDFGAGRVGFAISDPAGAYWAAVLDNGMDQEDLGAGPLPQDGGEHGTLGGGAVSIVSPDATEAERIAAILWTKTYYLDRYLGEDVAADAAKSQNEAGLPVGIPEVFPLSDAGREEYSNWIEPHVNVIPENYASYQESPVTTMILAEPPNSTQEVYAEIDAVIQQVLSEESADPEALLVEAQERIQNQLGR